MSTASALYPAAAARPFGHTLTIYLKEAKYEFFKYLRLPIYSVSTIMFPVMFYVLFGLLLNRQGMVGPVNVATYLIGSYGTFGVMGASLFSNGSGVAAERGLGWMQVKRASPMPPYAYFAAKFIVSMIFSMIVVLLLLGLGIAFGGVHVSLVQAAGVVATLVVGALPFCAMGLAIGYFVGPNSAPAAVNIFYLPMSFASGLWIPVQFLPHFLQRIALLLPPYHLSQLALRNVGAGSGSFLEHWEFLLGFTCIALGVARVGFQRDEGKMYG